MIEVASLCQLISCGMNCNCKQIPVVFIGVVCPHIVVFQYLLVQRCGPFLLSDWLKWTLVTPVQSIIGWQFYVGAYHSLWQGSANMDVLVTLGTTQHMYTLFVDSCMVQLQALLQ